MPNVKHKPWRTCAACREKKEQQQLVRYVLVDGQVHVDADFSLPGRGAYTCADEKCLHLALKRKAFYRAFRGEARIDAPQLAEEFSVCLKKK